MTSRERVRKTLTFELPERVPRQAWILPWAEERYPEVVRKLRTEYPDDIVADPQVYKNPLKTVGERYKPGIYIDEWGCIFKNVESGIIGIAHRPCLSSWKDLERFHPPEETLTVDRDSVNAFCKEIDQFVLGGSIVRPFERLQFIRTMGMAMIDLVEQPPELFALLRHIHDHYCKEVEVWAKTDVDAISLMDDWGVQTGLMVSPLIFRDFFKPMYRDYVEIAKHYGKFVFMHSDGYILDIIQDFIDVGIDALNAQIFCMGVEELGERFKGKLTFWGEIDRQHILPNGSKKDIEKAVRAIKENLYDNGGVIAQCEFGPGAKPENVVGVFEAWCMLDHKQEMIL